MHILVVQNRRVDKDYIRRCKKSQFCVLFNLQTSKASKYDYARNALQTGVLFMFRKLDWKKKI